MNITEIFNTNITKILSKFKSKFIDTLNVKKVQQKLSVESGTSSVQFNIDNFNKDAVFVFVDKKYTDDYTVSDNTVIFNSPLTSEAGSIEVIIINLQL